MQASWGWAGHHPQYPGHSSSSRKGAARRVQAGRVGHRGVFLRTEGTEAPGPGASCCQEGKGLGSRGSDSLGEGNPYLCMDCPKFENITYPGLNPVCRPPHCSPLYT